MSRVLKYLRIALLLLLAGGWIAASAWGLARATDYSWALWLEHWTGDIRTALLSHRPKRQHDQIALIAIGDATMQPYPYRSPIDRTLLANLITQLDKAGARAIGLDFLFLKQTEKAKDDRLTAAIRQARARVIVAAGDRRVGLSPAQTAYQKAFLKSSGAIAGYANLLTGGDRIVRYVARPEDPDFPKSFAVALARPDARPPVNGPRRIAWLLSPHDGNERFFSLPAHLIVTPDGKSTPVAAALLARIKDKIVIVGGDFPDLDRHQIPMMTWRGEEDEVAGMLIHAQVAAQLLDGRNIEHLDRQLLMGLFAVLALLGLWFGLRHGFVAVGLYATTASVLVVAADMALFQFADRIIPFGACFAALILGVGGGIVLRPLARVAMIRPT
ncbi:MAG: CHASE2 domain-containing protein [Hyphomicrobiaceae bacterium]